MFWGQFLCLHLSKPTLTLHIILNGAKSSTHLAAVACWGADFEFLWNTETFKTNGAIKDKDELNWIP